MTIKDTFTPMADHLRAEYGVDGLLTTEQLKAGINGLHVQNLLDEGQSYDSAVGSGWKDLTGLRNHFSLLPGKTITISLILLGRDSIPAKIEVLVLNMVLSLRIAPRFGLAVGSPLQLQTDRHMWLLTLKCIKISLQTIKRVAFPP